MSPVRAKRGQRAPKLDFPVTAEMIDTAVPRDSSHCMIVDGLKAAFPYARKPTVDLATIRFTDPATGRRYIYLTPEHAQLALLNFDHGIKPEPFLVTGYAAQIVEARKRRTKEPSASLEKTPKDASEEPSASLSETPKDASEDSSASLSETPKRTLRRAQLVSNPAVGKYGSPIKIGGTPPPVGPLARGQGTGAALRLGRRRQFGLRVMGQASVDLRNAVEADRDRDD